MDGANLKFNTSVEVDINHESEDPKGFTYDTHSSKTNVKYEVVIEAREWGIKSLSCISMEQEISLEIDLLDAKDEDASSEKKFFKVKITDMETDTDNMNWTYGSIPSTLDLTLKNIHQIDDYNFEAEASGVLIFGT